MWPFRKKTARERAFKKWRRAFRHWSFHAFGCSVCSFGCPGYPCLRKAELEEELDKAERELRETQPTRGLRIW